MQKEEQTDILKSNISTETIAVAGVSDNTGVTHLCIMLAVFLSSVAAKKVALVEMNQSGCIRQAGIILDEFHVKARKTFHKVAIFTQADEENLSEVISSDYDYVIIDYGKYDEDIRQSFIMCRRKIIVGSLSWWKIQHYVGFLAKADKKAEYKWEYYAVNPVTWGIRYLRHTFGINIRLIPFEPDPFLLGRNTLEFMTVFFGSRFWK